MTPQSEIMDTKKVIIIGATSGIGKELALVFSSNGYEIGITGRRKNLLSGLASQLQTKTYISSFDVRDTEIAMTMLGNLISDMGNVDIIIINAGTGSINKMLDWAPEKDTIDTNVSGFIAMANVSIRFFINKKAGHLVGISSIAGLMPNNQAPAYSSSKAFISNYLLSLRGKMEKEKLPVFITDIIPGFVRTEMAKGEGLFWVASPKKAAKQIYSAITRKKKTAYITKRWIIIAFLIKFIPARFIARL